MAKIGAMVPKGEKVERSTTVDLDERTIVVLATSKKEDADPASLYHRWTFDMTDVEESVMWHYAARGIVIDMQRVYRASEDAPEDWADRTLVYPADFKRDRQPSKPSRKGATTYLETLTPEERLALVEAMNAEESADDGE